MHTSRRGEVLRRFFAGLTEYAFYTRLGLADPPVIDYLSELLARFVETDEVYALRSVRGQRLTQVADMLEEAGHRQGPARRQVHRHIGDFTLFWTGVYPEVADRLQQGNKDSLLNYPAQGKRNYYLASKIATEPADESSEVFERLSANFELCVYGLGEVRRQWEEQGDSPTQIIL